MIPRSKRLQFPSGLTEKDHLLRVARGALMCGVPLPALIQAIEAYVDDATALDRQPLWGWWQLGGPLISPEEQDAILAGDEAWEAWHAAHERP